MEKSVKITVVMPVYNVEKYVGKAIESILTQTLKEYEFIIIDDGSPDNSGSICDEYARKDKRIRVIHKENGGAPSARNIAIDCAKGKYLYFIDSDDWAEPEMLKDMYALAETNKAQLVITGYYIDTYYNENEYLRQDVFYSDLIFKSKDEFRKAAYRLFDNNLLYAPWNKLYLTEHIRKNGIRFPDTFWDDFPFNLNIIRDIERVVVSSKKYYHFLRARTESETTKYVSRMYEKREEEHIWLTDLYRYWGIDDDNSREFIARRYIERLVGCIENVTNKNCALTTREKKHRIMKMISNDRVRESLRYAKPNSLMMKMMLLPIRWSNADLALLEGRLISMVKSRNIRLFATLKANR